MHTLHAHPSQGLAFREALRKAKEEGVQAVLVLTPPMAWEDRNRLKALLLREGLPSQILNVPLREGNATAGRTPSWASWPKRGFRWWP